MSTSILSLKKNLAFPLKEHFEQIKDIWLIAISLRYADM